MVDESKASGTSGSPVWKRALGWLAVVLIVAAVAFGALRIFIRPIPPGQLPPDGHPGASCALCHIVTDSVEPVTAQ